MYYEHYLKNKEILSFEKTWMNLGGIMLSKISQTEEKQIPHGLADMWNLKEKKKKKAEIIEIKQTSSCQGFGGWKKIGDVGKMVHIFTFKLNEV